MNPTYECPKCDEWIEITPGTKRDLFNCPWCGEKLRLDADADFENGSWHDRSKLVTAGSHWDERDVHSDTIEEMESWEQGNPEGEK